MAFIRRNLRLIVVGASCVAVGAGASVIASAGAASSSSPAAHHRGAGTRRLLARAVHGQVVVATKTGFATITFDRGFIQSVNGQQLTLREGTKTRTYKVVTLTIPTTARVRADGAPATLSQLKPGQRATVVQGPKNTRVVARTPRA